ncbi:hypothetical protein MKX03_002376 [Papaver bracteatum]|nr:hypothetical protein MKX03_002376 [Papaver bracteatum]
MVPWTLEQLPRHLDERDCRVQIGGVVYHVANFLRRYPQDRERLRRAAEASNLLADYDIHWSENTRTTERNVRRPQMYPARHQPSVRDWLEFQVHRFMQQDLLTKIIALMVVLVLMQILYMFQNYCGM